MVTGTRSEGPGTTAPTALEAELRRLAGAVADPELPVLTLEELGILRGVEITGPGRVEVTLTPTYTGCPAIETMSADIEQALHDHGIPQVTVRPVLSPPWTTDDISDEGRRKLREAGIAPPRVVRSPGGPVPVSLGPTRAAGRSGGAETGPVPLVTGSGDSGDRGGSTSPSASASAPAPAPAPAPGDGPVPPPSAPHADDAVHCPHCGSGDTELLSRFSSTACKALRRCLACREPFDHFKEL
ncbi:iron-sulfur cluster assembly protein [Streptomyces sp. TS71-3]|uniref:PaaD-like zinc ribbon domain-containing protein n=1 Tax=Streptomyces sp. TS71-3 TaxID=2733862 RepID=UPI001B1A4442|nr:iron-sulfur cluster assembly protein [Streptomyces sp. TS71-3]GHJ40296.1 hypothetical protein Sm713_59050 [Streptomyces sp. TS71-3]